jgi:hypothetical protein
MPVKTNSQTLVLSTYQQKGYLFFLGKDYES